LGEVLDAEEGESMFFVLEAHFGFAGSVDWTLFGVALVESKDGEVGSLEAEDIPSSYVKFLNPSSLGEFANGCWSSIFLRIT
jgi:hypothetical protein